MARHQSHLLSILSFLLFIILYHPIRCIPIQSLKSTSNIVETRTLPHGAQFVPDNGLFLVRSSKILSIMAPNVAAASALADFYLHVVAKAIFEATSGSPEENNFFFTQGPLTLIFVADSWGKTIPWGFVADFANSMADLAHRGFLATYDRGYWNVQETLGVYAGLRVEGLAPLS